MTAQDRRRECGRLVLVALAAIVVVAVSLEGLERDFSAADEQLPYVDPHTENRVDPSNQSNLGIQSQIIVSAPKVWQYERVEALMDGLLRDVEGISVKDLTLLDPNSANATNLDFLQTMFEASFKYDQAAGIRLRNEQATYDVTSGPQRAQLDDYNLHVAALREQRLRLTTDYFAANNTVNQLEGLKAAGALSSDDEKRLATAKANAAELKTQLDTVGSMITSAGAPPAISSAPMPNSTAAPALISSPSTFGQFLGGLPDELKKSVVDSLKQPNYPATKRLENFMTLLRERLAAQVSVLQDDVVRNADTQVFLVQFDVGLYPHKTHKDQMANVEYRIKDCADCTVYSVYPGQSSYNVANFSGSSRRNKLSAVLGWIGFGLNAQYERQRDQLQSSMVQSVYAAGYHEKVNDVASVGWHYYPAPFEQYVSPGLRSTFALVAMKKRTGEAAKKIKLEVATSWSKKKEPGRPMQFSKVQLELPAMSNVASAAMPARDPNKLQILRIEYNPVTYLQDDTSTEPDPLSKCPIRRCTAVMLTFDQSVDANLVVTVRGRPLNRVRDWRGRATSVLPPAQESGNSKRTVRSLIERDDLEADSWYQLNSREILLNISRGLAGTSAFPAISLSDATHPTVLLPYDLGLDHTEVVVSGFRMVPRTPEEIQAYARRFAGPDVKPDATSLSSEADRIPLRTGSYPYSAFLPLFVPIPFTQKIFAYVGETGEDLLIGFAGDPVDAKGHAVGRKPWIDTRTRVILEDRDLDFAWPLTCVAQGPMLNCELPLDTIRDTYLNIVRVCDTVAKCPAIRKSIEHIAVPIATSFAKSQNAFRLFSSRPLADREALRSQQKAPTEPALKSLAKVGVTSLQVWISQFDPDDHPGLDSAEPAALPFVALSPDNAERPFRFSAYNWRTGEVTLENCGVLASTTIELKLLGTSRESVVVPYAPVTGKQSCRAATLKIEEFRRDVMVFQAMVPLATEAAPVPTNSSITFPVNVAPLLPHFETPTTFPRQRVKDKKVVTEQWDIEWPVTRVACGDTITLGALNGSPDVSVAWVVGADNSANPCTASTADDFKGGLAKLRLSIKRAAVTRLPRQLEILRQVGGPKEPETLPLPGARSVVVASTDLQALLLPTSLALEPIGGSGFVLRGDGEQAGEISAVLVQKDGESDRLPAVSSGAFAHVNMEKQKPGNYVVVPIVTVDGVDFPLRVIGTDGQRLSYTKPKPPDPEKPEPKLDNKTTTRTTVTRTRESSGNASPSAATPKSKP